MLGARTHEAIDPELCGRLVSLAEGTAVVELRTVARISVAAGLSVSAWC